MYKIETIYSDGQFNVTRTHDWNNAVQCFCSRLESSKVMQCQVFDSKNILVLSYTKPKGIYS